MSWVLLVLLVVALGVALFGLAARRAELARMRGTIDERERLRRHGAQAKLHHPQVDLSRCLGCGTCVAVCPEERVLDLVHGQAMVVNPSRCEGVSACERECPVGAITVTIANLEERRDIPTLTAGLEAPDAPGLFLAGEVTAHALIKPAIDQGVAVGAEVARRVAAAGGAQPGLLDLCIVGAGPAGLACSLEARRQGLEFVTLDQEEHLGGTVAKYPRRKLVMTQPVELPIYGRFKQRTWTKEELMTLWQGIAAEQRLPIRCGQVLEGVERAAAGGFEVRTREGTLRARHVCLALGRRGSPRRLGVPGEELPKVAYALMDARSYQRRRVLVVGGGDSAVEAAVGLAEQPGNRVTLSYRREGFFRIKARNEERLERARRSGRLEVLLRSEVRAITPDAVELEQAADAPVAALPAARQEQARAEGESRTDGAAVGTSVAAASALTIPNDDVFVMIGGRPPFELLRRCGVAFDPPAAGAGEPVGEQGTGLVRALGAGFALALFALAFALWNADYYMLERVHRPLHEKHDLLRPDTGLGLWLGIGGAGLILLNLAYLLRRSPRVRFELGSLRLWMTSHVATGILAFLCVLLHAAMAPKDTVGGHAFWALAALVVTGAIGRYFYAYVPRAANGKELELSAARARLAAIAAEWDSGGRGFHERVRRELAALTERHQWRRSFFGRLLALVGGERELHRVLARLQGRARIDGVPEAEAREALELARRAHRASLMAAHFEDLRALLGTWRYLHRWVAVLMVILVAMHLAYALVYGVHFFDGASG